MNGRRTRTSAIALGFTLLEVLVAMAILSLGMIAVFSGMNQSLNVTTRLRDKTLASWVATNRITEIQVTGQIPGSNSQSDQVEMAGVRWVYQLTVTPVPDFEMRRLDVTVSYADTPEDILATVTGFVSEAPRGGDNQQQIGAQRQATDPIADFGSGWEPPVEEFGEIQ